MTKQHFIGMASIVKSILDGNWTDEQPPWAIGEFDSGDVNDSLYMSHYRRACQTAEAFIALGESYNAHFNRSKFLKACGLSS